MPVAAALVESIEPVSITGGRIDHDALLSE
jgi:hypothetical protein